MRRYRFLLFLAAVFAAKLVVVLQLRDHPLLQAAAGLDSHTYAQLASRVVAGDLLLGPGRYFASPLYTYFLALLLWAGQTFMLARVVQIGLGTAAVGCIFVAARLWFGPRAAWLAAVVAGLTGLFTFHEILLVQASLDPFLTAAALAALARALVTRQVPWFAAAGLAFGVQALNRPAVLVPALAVVALLAGARRSRPALVMAAGLAAALLPAAVRNYAVAGEWSPLPSNGGLNFYIGNNAAADGTYREVPGMSPGLEGQHADARRVAEAGAGRALDDGGVSAYFAALGWSWIRLHPGDALRLFLRKLHYAFNAAHIPLNYSYPFYAQDESTLLRALFAGPWLIIPLGLAGLTLGLAATAPRRLDYAIWLAFVPVYALSLAAFFVTEPNRLPLLVPLCIGAGHALDRIVFRAYRGRRAHIERAATLAAVISLALLVNRPIGVDDGRAEERTRMAEGLIVRDQLDAAEAWVRKAEQIHPSPGLVHFRVGRLLVVHSRPGPAVVHLQRAQTLSPDRPEIEYALGQALVAAGRPKEAIPHLEGALRAGVRVDLAGFDLARARAALGDKAGALQVLQSVTPANPGDVKSWDALGQLARQLGSPSLAAVFFGQAVTAAPRAPRPRQDLGLALAAMGRYTEAIAQLERAVALDAADPGAQLNLAMAFAAVGRHADAQSRAREALRLKPDYEPARQFLRALK